MRRLKLFAVAVVGIVLAISAARAQTTFKYITAIAFDETTGIYGWSTGWLYHRDAVQAAKEACRRRGGINCKLAVPGFTSCGALSKGSKEGYWGIGDTKDLAALRAMDSCGKDGNPACKVLVSLCSGSGTIEPPSTSPIPHSSPSTASPSEPPVRVCPPGSYRGLGGCYAY